MRIWVDGNVGCNVIKTCGWKLGKEGKSSLKIEMRQCQWNGLKNIWITHWERVWLYVTYNLASVVTIKIA